ncbi:MAG TPA: serine hydrolase domain-containing protein [Candidatus Sulfotelmatobacter sp.]|nr:serine hydrolase domain-containing protein [Candidatus Sulfotelmatobacter sp.]
MRFLIRVFVPLLSLSGFLCAQQLSPPEIAKIDQVFADYAKPDSPGCSLGIFRNDSIAYAHGYGLASLELGVPITPQTVFDIGSTSKQFTAFSILLLQQQGKLSVDDDVRKFVPEIPDYGKRITLHHLMTHTSGMRDYAGLFDLAGVPEQNLTNDQDALDLIVRQKALNFAPGDEWDYSNTGFFLLSQVVQRVTGKTLRDFEQENIFRPLGMSSTVIFNDHTQVVPHRATGYSYDQEKKTFGVEMSNFEQTGDGSIQTSVQDLLRWDANFYTAKIGGPDLIKEMQVVGKLNNGKEHNYAAGLEISTYRGQPTVRHGGAWAGYRAELLRFPKQHTSVAVLCNVAQSAPSVRADRVADVLLANVLAPAAKKKEEAGQSVDPKILEKYVGVYKNDNDAYQRVELKDGKLILANYGIELIPVSASSFRTNFTEGTISFADKQMVFGIEDKPETYNLIQVSAPTDLSSFAGDYYSPELDATWQLTVQNGELKTHVKHSDSPAMTLRPVSDDTFMLLEGGSLRIENQGGRPARAFLTVDRIRNIEFTRN